MNKMNKIAGTVALLTIALLQSTKASTLMQYELGLMTSGGASISTGTVFFISSGVDGTFNSVPSSLATGSLGLLAGDDKMLSAFAIAGGVVAGNWEELYTQAAAGQKISALFVNGLTSSNVSFTTGLFTGGKTVGASGGTSYAFGTYRTDSIETLGANVADAIPWVLPANTGATATIAAYSGAGDYTGQDFTANLATSASFNLIPEPSIGSLLAIGAAGLAFLRARRKS